jgi:transposase
MNRTQTIPKELRYTVEQFNVQFPNDEACFQTIAERRFPGGMAQCDKCETLRKHHRATGRTAYACDHCGNHIYPLAGTIFEKTTTKLRLWFYAMYLMSSTRCGISAKQIQRETGVTYKTAWRMFKQIRSLLNEDIRLEGYSVEIDETYIGGKRKNRHGSRGMRGRDNDEKTPVFGMVERGGRVIACVTPDVKASTLFPIIEEKILPNTTVYSDEYSTYDQLHGLANCYNHKRIKHAQKIYVMGDVHTQTIEGFWSLVKRGIGGVYHSVSRKYLQTYLNEYSFRYNRRNSGNLIFHAVLDRAVQPLVAKPDPTDGKKTPEISVPF